MIKTKLLKYSDSNKAKHLSRFFKTGVGEYGYGDIFAGINVPVIRNVAKEFVKNDISEITPLLSDPIHEVRLCGLLILVEKYKKTKDTTLRQELFNTYIDNILFVNNWDLVDLSCPHIIGEYSLSNNNSQLLYNMVTSDVMWVRRIAIVSTFWWIKNCRFDATIYIAEKLLDDKHDLIHKSVGWMLREMGKRDIELLRVFLSKYCTKMPRTMLRYSIEKMSGDERNHWLKISK